MQNEPWRPISAGTKVEHDVHEGVLAFQGELLHGVTELVTSSPAHFLCRQMRCRPDVHFRGQQHVWATPAAPDIVLSEILVAGRRGLDGISLRPRGARSAGTYDLGLALIQPGDEIRLRLVNFSLVTLAFSATLHGESW